VAWAVKGEKRRRGEEEEGCKGKKEGMSKAKGKRVCGCVSENVCV